MSKTTPILLLAILLLSGCGNAAIDANPHYADQIIESAFNKESAFCRAVANNESNPQKHLHNLPPWGYLDNFTTSLLELGYEPSFLTTSVDNRYIYSQVATNTRAYSKKPQERYDMCISELGWKNKNNFSRAERDDNDKNTRATALVSEMKNDPQAELTLNLMNAALYAMAPYKAAQENFTLLDEPDNFSASYYRHREVAHKTPAVAKQTIRDINMGIALARCSGVYSVVNGNRQELIQREPGSRDRFISQERESLELSTGFINHDMALSLKEAGAVEFIQRSGTNLPGILMQFQTETPQCSKWVREAKQTSTAPAPARR